MYVWGQVYFIVDELFSYNLIMDSTGSLSLQEVNVFFYFRKLMSTHKMFKKCKYLRLSHTAEVFNLLGRLYGLSHAEMYVCYTKQNR